MENILKVTRTVKIGVVGPSKATNIESVQKRVRDILVKIDDKLSDTPYYLIVISPLSEGFDRILTEEIMNFKGSNNHLKSCLEVILKEDNNENKEDFIKLMDLSVSKKKISDILSEDVYKGIAKDYTHTGQVVVDKCDFLIAVMEENSEGDTAYIVEYAKNHSSRPIFIINPSNESISEININYFLKSLEFHNIYNQEKISLKNIQKSKKGHQYLIDKMNSFNLNLKQRKFIENNIFTQFLIANSLAMKYQSKHYWSINLVYYFSAAAIAIVAFQLLFLPHYPQILVIEAVMMFIIIALLIKNKRNDWHRKWIDYRYLAERLRAGMIFQIVGLECKVFDHLPHQRLSGDWILNVYESLYREQLVSCHDLDFEKIKEFILNQWILDQANFYGKKSIFNDKKDKIYNYIIYIAFLVALIGAVIHALGFMIHDFEIPIISNITTFAVIVFPALAASCAGIRTQHEYLRLSKHYRHMESYLRSVDFKIKNIDHKDEKKLIELLERANMMMLREHQDWRTTFSAREPELP